MVKSKDRFFNFDILKCIAISMVLFIHIVASELYILLAECACRYLLWLVDFFY